jgi:hypothetical protein
MNAPLCGATALLNIRAALGIGFQSRTGFLLHRHTTSLQFLGLFSQGIFGRAFPTMVVLFFIFYSLLL